MTKMKQLVNKMGWNDMPANVALDAAQRMVNNHIACIADCCGECLTTLEVLEFFLDDENYSNSSDNLWLELFITDYQTLNDGELKSYALLMRGDIEMWMRRGESFEEACEEWDIPSVNYYKNYYGK